MAINPVTQTALVDVKSASTKLTLTPGRLDMGVSRRKVPAIMTRKKPRVIRRPGGWFLKNSIMRFISLSFLLSVVIIQDIIRHCHYIIVGKEERDKGFIKNLTKT